MPKARPRIRKDRIKMVVECRACGWRWTPNPKLWRNRKNPTKGRTLKCPACGIPNRISAEDVKKTWKYNY